MKTFFIKTFGCQMNEADSEKLAGWYQSHGWQPARSIKEADEIIINTCSVRESAEHRVLGLINSLKFPKTPRLPKVILTGCMLYHGITTLKKKLPDVDEFKPINDFKIPQNFKFKISNLKLVNPGYATAILPSST